MKVSMRILAPLLLVALGSSLAVPAVAANVPRVKSGFFRTSDGIRLHYLEAGRGPAIVFVPGWTVPAWMWGPQLRHFASSHRVIALDPRSQGESQQATDGHYPERRARDVYELVQTLKLAPAVLVGHSLAVTELLSYAEHFGGGTLAGLVLVDQDFGPYPKPEEAAQLYAFLRQVSMDRRRLLETMGPAFYRKPTPPGYMKRLIDDAMKVPTNTAVALIAGRSGMDFHPMIAKLDVPILYTITPEFRAEGEWLAKTLPSARVVVFENAGHVLFMDEPNRFHSVLGEFARSAFAARASAR